MDGSLFVSGLANRYLLFLSYILTKGADSHQIVVGLHSVIKAMQDEFLAILGISATTFAYLVYHFSTTSLSDSYLWGGFIAGADAVLNWCGYFRK